MSDKRANIGIWKVLLEDSESPDDRSASIVASYQRLSKADPGSYAPLIEVELDQSFVDVEVALYVRRRSGLGFYPFVADYLVYDGDKTKFRFRAVDVCLFIATATSLYAVTTGSGHRIIEDYADYSFPFDVAKRLVANNFRAAEMRQFTGATTNRVETYRRGQSIASSESFGKVWKRLVGRLNSGLLSKDSYLRKLIDPSKPPAIEVKSSFVLRKSLNLRQLVLLIQEIEDLPDASEEQRRELSFLDSLYQVKSRSLIAELKRQVIENLRRAAANGEQFDLDICDPDDVARYYTGSRFKLSYWDLDGEPPDADDVLDVIRSKYQDYLQDADSFFERVSSSRLRYSTSADGETPPISGELYKFMHAQVEHEGQSYFLLDKVWYRIQGDFLANLKNDFIHETFESVEPIWLKAGLLFLPWDDADEDAFNRRQADEEGFYYGDKIFAMSNRGKVELFDLLKVDEASKTLYVIHVKEGFDAKMRDACSQISISAEVIGQDLMTDKSVLREYYSEWKKHDINVGNDIDEEEFLGWFSWPNIVYVVLASTKAKFTARSFQKDVLRSHIARREVIATRNEFRSHGSEFRLAHTLRVKK